MQNIEQEAENKIIDSIGQSSAARLIVFKPDVNKLGANLAIERRGKYKESQLFFQINTFMSPSSGKIFSKDFLQDDFKGDKNFYLLFACFDEVKQKINDYIWLIPSLEFRDMAEVAKNADGKKVLHFEVALDPKNKNKYSRFLVDLKELGKMLLDSFESGGKLKFQATDFDEKQSVNVERLKEFISEARRNTYAGNGTKTDNPRLTASSQFDFQKGDFAYRDVHFSGEKKFIGQEIVYQNSKPVWGMSYLGTQLGKLEADFLKESLFKLALECRFGQQCEHEKREYKYQDFGKGAVEEFSGTEEIFVSNKNIYKLDYQGGLI